MSRGPRRVGHRCTPNRHGDIERERSRHPAGGLAGRSPARPRRPPDPCSATRSWRARAGCSSAAVDAERRPTRSAPRRASRGGRAELRPRSAPATSRSARRSRTSWPPKEREEAAERDRARAEREAAAEAARRGRRRGASAGPPAVRRRRRAAPAQAEYADDAKDAARLEREAARPRPGPTRSTPRSDQMNLRSSPRRRRRLHQGGPLAARPHRAPDRPRRRPSGAELAVDRAEAAARAPPAPCSATTSSSYDAARRSSRPTSASAPHAAGGRGRSPRRGRRGGAGRAARAGGRAPPKAQAASAPSTSAKAEQDAGGRDDGHSRPSSAASRPRRRPRRSARRRSRTQGEARPPRGARGREGRAGEKEEALTAADEASASRPRRSEEGAAQVLM